MKRTKKAERRDVANARWWAATSTGGKQDKRLARFRRQRGGTDAVLLFIECATWFDARRVARMLLGPEAVITGLPEKSVLRTPRHRVQVRWEGSAASRALDLRLQHRFVGGGKPSPWLDV